MPKTTENSALNPHSLVADPGQYKDFALKAMAEYLLAEAGNQRARLRANIDTLEMPVTVVDAVVLPGSPQLSAALIPSYMEWGAAFGINHLMMIQPPMAKESLARIPAIDFLPENAPNLFDCNIVEIAPGVTCLISGRHAALGDVSAVLERERRRGRRVVLLPREDGGELPPEVYAGREAVVSMNLTSRVLRDPFRGREADRARIAFQAHCEKQLPVNVVGYTLAPHPWALGGIFTLLPGIKPDSQFHPLSIDIPHGAIVTQAPIIKATVENQPMGTLIRSYGLRLTVEFKASDVCGLHEITVWVNGERIRQFDAHERKTYDAGFLLKKPDVNGGLFALWLECTSIDGKRAITDPIWIR
ncbi:MAG TPA: hypothetical protein VL860_00845 [Planctomycetota bacterium]|nr:hypothetical protein [Planctomycetota bacterium]